MKMIFQAVVCLASLLPGGAIAQPAPYEPPAVSRPVTEPPVQAERRIMPPSVDPRIAPSESVRPADDPNHPLKDKSNNP
jgi:hypothetical protein